MNQYWKDEQEQLVVQYQNESDQVKRSMIYHKLRPAIQTMTEIILKRYYGKSFRFDEIKELLLDGESHVILSCLPNFKPGNAKSYSYIGTCIKHYFYDRCVLKKGKPTETIPLYFATGEIEFDLEDDGFNEVEFNRHYSELKQLANERIDELELSGNSTKIVMALRELVKQSNFGRYYASYLLLKLTKLTPEVLKKSLWQLGMLSIYHTGHKLQWYEQQIIEGKSKGIPAKEYLNTIEHETKNKKYFPIQQKKKPKRKKQLSTVN